MKPYSASVHAAAAANGCPITVCVPVYNGAAYLLDCLNSIAAQTHSDFIAVAVDNASTDATPDICKAYEDRRFFYIRNEENIGSIRNHSRALDLAHTEFVKLFSADDVLMPETLGLQLQALREHSSAVLATSDCIVTGPNLEPLGTARYLDGYRTGSDVIKACVQSIDNKIGGPSNTLLRTHYVGGERFDARYKWLADLEFHCRVLRYGDYVNINRAGFLYRRHSATDSEVGCPLDVRERDELAFVQQYSSSPLPRLRYEVRRLKRRLELRR